MIKELEKEKVNKETLKESKKLKQKILKNNKIVKK